MRRNVLADVRARVDRRGPEECWPWVGACAGGYGQIQIDWHKMPAHRAAYELEHGPIPDGLVVCHSCDFKLCCNPAHLFLGTVGDNTRDAQRKGLLAHGERAARARLKEEQVLAIRMRAAAGERFADLARAFEVTPTNVRFIVRRLTWRHV